MASYYDTEYVDRDRPWQVWQRADVYDGEGTGKWVPNPGDLVFDKANGFYLVIDVDYTTKLSTLQRWSEPEVPENNDGFDVLLGDGPGYASESFRVFYDDSVTPPILAPDSQLAFKGSLTDHYKVFLGTDISEATGKVISALYDASGNFLGTSIPVELVGIQDLDGTSIAWKAPMVGNSTEALETADLVTLVAYSDDGAVQSRNLLTVVKSSTARRTDLAKKYISAIKIDSPFISSSDPQTIEFPLNVTVQSLPMYGMVYYSDGSKLRLPIDGTKFSLYGINNYIATTTGQRMPMLLSYALSEDEVAVNIAPTANRRMTLEYTAKTIAVDGAYQVKLFAYPVWQGPTAGYRLVYWLYNLDRQTYYNATPYVELASNSAPFDPTRYGSTQTITVAVDLDAVDGKFAPYRHVQTLQISLLTRGDEIRDNWLIGFTPDQPEVYGRDLMARVEFVNVNYWKLDISCNMASRELWLENLYEKIQPLYNSQTETGPVTPTHVRLQFLHNQYEISIDQWDQIQVVVNDLNDGELVYLQWIKRLRDQDLQLGMSALSLHQISET